MSKIMSLFTNMLSNGILIQRYELLKNFEVYEFIYLDTSGRQKIVVERFVLYNSYPCNKNFATSTRSSFIPHKFIKLTLPTDVSPLIGWPGRALVSLA